VISKEEDLSVIYKNTGQGELKALRGINNQRKVITRVV
jgi:hypothetical protein